MRTSIPTLVLTLLPMLYCTGCGGEVQNAGAGWVLPDDAAPWPDGLTGDDGGGPTDTRPDTSPDVTQTDAPDLDSDAPDLFCTPGARICEDLTVWECTLDGQDLAEVADCDDGNACTEDLCLAGECLNEPLGSCCDPPCPMGELCFNGECVCAAQCLGQECGDDGCGGTCGECPEQHHCTPAGLCVCDPVCEGPDETILECGPDGCGGSCGICEGPQDLCLSHECICQPDCGGKECGPDGCGGPCGDCPGQHECSADGLCVCIPACEGKQCGPDGCGGVCGNCDGPLYVCGGAGICAQDPAFAPVLGVCTPHLDGQAVYYLCTEPVKWDDAKDYCANNGTWLVTITTAAEQAFVTGLAAIAGTSLWIGLDQGFWEWDSFDWVTGEDKPVTYWAEGEPNDGGMFQSEDCGEIHPSGAWNDEQCSSQQWFICEYS